MRFDLQLSVAGILQVSLAFAHLGFGRRLGWKDDLARLSLVNRQIFQVHTFFIGLVLVLFGMLDLLAGKLLLDGSVLARSVSGGLAVFWGARLWVQWFVFDHRLWRGKRFETTVHAIFTLLWTWLCALHLLVSLA